MEYKLGWIPGAKDNLAPKFGQQISGLAVIPAKVDLRDKDCPIFNQGNIGSCTAQAGAALARFVMKKEGHEVYTPSRLFIYYNSRFLLGWVDKDMGSTLTHTVKAMMTNGLPNEKMWWYNDAKYAVKPSKKVYIEGLKHKALSHFGIEDGNLDEMRQCLAMGFPFIFGALINKDFSDTTNGVIPMYNGDPLGGHAMMAVGYDDMERHFIVRNSWGTTWGDNGYCYMPYEYLADRKVAEDFWTIHTID